MKKLWIAIVGLAIAAVAYAGASKLQDIKRLKNGKIVASFKDGKQSVLGDIVDSGWRTDFSETITWTGTGPTTPTIKYRWIKNGPKVDMWFHARYGSAGSGVTAFHFPLPSNFPTPSAIDTSGSNWEYPGSASVDENAFNSLYVPATSSMAYAGGAFQVRIYPDDSINMGFWQLHTTYISND